MGLGGEKTGNKLISELCNESPSTPSSPSLRAGSERQVERKGREGAHSSKSQRGVSWPGKMGLTSAGSGVLDCKEKKKGFYSFKAVAGYWPHTF